MKNTGASRANSTIDWPARRLMKRRMLVIDSVPGQVGCGRLDGDLGAHEQLNEHGDRLERRGCRYRDLVAARQPHRRRDSRICRGTDHKRRRRAGAAQVVIRQRLVVAGRAGGGVGVLVRVVDHHAGRLPGGVGEDDVRVEGPGEVSRTQQEQGQDWRHEGELNQGLPSMFGRTYRKRSPEHTHKGSDAFLRQVLRSTPSSAVDVVRYRIAPGVTSPLPGYWVRPLRYGSELGL